MTISGAAVIPPVVLPANTATSVTGEGVVTLGGQVYTAYAAGSSRVVVDGHTVEPGSATVVNGETISLSGTDLIVMSGTVTSSEGLGGAIMSGLNGPGGPASTSTAVTYYTGASEHIKPARWLEGLVVVMLAAFIL